MSQAPQQTAAYAPESVPRETYESVKRLVLVEDDEELRDLYCFAFEAEGFHAIAFPDAETAIRSDAMDTADILVVDVHLPGKSGIDLAEQVLKIREMPVIALTASRAAADVREALRAGVTEYLFKPVQAEEIVSVVSRILGTKRVENKRAPRVRLMIGETVADTPYVLKRWVGEGGMGTVYLGQHKDLGRDVALKILHAEMTSRVKSTDRFRAEARTTASLGSEHIIEIYDFIELPDGRLMIVMEYVKGNDLYAEVMEEPLSASRAHGILRQLCRALGTAHGSGIVHRDVKPDNVLLTRRDDGRDDAVKLVDFGIAAMLSDAAGGGVTCTPAYAAPEQIRGTDFDGRLDIYALGCTAFHMLAGRPPFDHEEVKEILRSQLKSEPPSFADFGVDVPAPLEEVVLKCMAKDPADRFASMADVEAALCEAQIAAGYTSDWDDLPLPEVDEARKKWIREHMPERSRARRRGMMAIGLAAVLGAGIATTWFALRDPPVVEASEIDSLTARARAEAASAKFVYPPPEDPDASTAYLTVLELEGLEGELEGAGDTRGAELREEFAGALKRFGDTLWAQDGGRPYARDFYAQALMFVPEDEVAKERAGFTPGMIADMGAKAASRKFTPAELAAAEVLLALAATDEGEREERRKRLAKRGNASRTGEDRLARVLDVAVWSSDPILPVDADAGGTEVAPADAGDDGEILVDTDTEGVDTEGVDTEGVDTEGVDAEGGEPDEGGEAKQSKRDPQMANKLARRAREALNAGRRNEAEKLFHRALSYDYKNLAALDGLGDLNFHGGRFTASLRFRKSAVRYSPRSGTRRAKLGDAYFKVLRYQDALREYEKAKRYGYAGADTRIKKVNDKLGSR